MVRRKVIHKKKTPPQLKTRPLDLAFSWGKTTHTVARKMKRAVTAVEKNLSLAKRSFKEGARAGTRARKSRVKILPNANEAPLSSIQKEVRSLFDISGLTDTIVEMDKISLRHSSHPVVHRLLTKIK